MGCLYERLSYLLKHGVILLHAGRCSRWWSRSRKRASTKVLEQNSSRLHQYLGSISWAEPLRASQGSRKNGAAGRVS